MPLFLYHLIKFCNSFTVRYCIFRSPYSHMHKRKGNARALMIMTLSIPYRCAIARCIGPAIIWIKHVKPRLHDRTSCIQLVIWNFLFHIPCRATRYNLIYISLKIPAFHWVMQTCWHSLIWVKVKQESAMFSADSGVVWAVQCFALLKFIIPFVFLISCTLWEMIQHNWNNL